MGSDRWPWLCLFIILTVTSFAIRVLEINRPPFIDEAKTWVWFVKDSWRQVLSNYGIVGNHIFQTALSRISYLLFGDSPWVFRLPVFVAGLAVVLGFYGFARMMLGRKTAICSLVLIGASIPLINYSVDARGYMIVAVLFLGLLIVSSALRRDPSNLGGWIAFVVIAGLSLWTVPVATFGIGIAGLWFIWGVGRDEILQRLLRLGVAGVGVGVFTGILYSPVIYRMGVSPIVGNETIGALDWGQFWSGCPECMVNLSMTFWRGFPIWLQPLLWFLGGIGLLAAERKGSPLRGLGWSAIVVVLSLLIVKQVLPYPRHLVYLLPLLIIYVAHGIIATTGFLGRSFGSLRPNVVEPRFLPFILFVSFSLFCFTSVARVTTGQCKSMEDMIRDLADEIGSGDIVQSETPLCGPAIYFMTKYGIGRDRHFWPSHEEDFGRLTRSRRVFTIVVDRLVPLESYFEKPEIGGESLSSPVLWRSYEDGTIYLQTSVDKMSADTLRNRE